MRQDPLGSPGPLPRLAAEVRAARPSLGPVRLVAVDGHAGSGKTTFAGRLAEALGGAPVLHLDDLATHEEPFAWTARLREQVLAPLSRGVQAQYRPYDWHRRAFGPPRPLPAAPVVLLEGVGAGRRAVRPVLARLLWMEVDARTAHGRGQERDGAEQAAFWRGWVPAERRHFASDPSRPFADTLVRPGAREPALLSGPGREAANPRRGDRG
ncbi:uridine kinase [Streptomyces albidoflavus]